MRLLAKEGAIRYISTADVPGKQEVSQEMLKGLLLDTVMPVVGLV